MLSLISHPWVLFGVLFLGLLMAMEIGLRARRASSNIDDEQQLLITSARDGLTVLLSFLLGFALPMALPHYEQRRNLMIGEANAIATVDQRAQILPEPFRGKILQLLREYVDARIEFAKGDVDEPAVEASVAHASQLQNEMWQENVAMVQQYPSMVITPIFTQCLGRLSDLNEQRFAAYESRIPTTIWSVLILISVLSCFVVGYSMRRRFFLAMVVSPLTVAIVLSLVLELDAPRTGFIRVGQQSMQRLQRNRQNERCSEPIVCLPVALDTPVRIKSLPSQ